MVTPKVVLFSLGGTIATTWRPTGGSSAVGATAQDLIGLLGDAGDEVDVEPRSFRTCPSGDLSASDMIELAGEVESACAGGARGVVVSQGTNTLEETAFLLDRLVGADNPVVVTGAMRPTGAPGADGPANLLASLRVAASPLAGGLGTLVVFNDEIHAARFVSKTHGISTAAFRSVNAGPLGWLVEGRVRIPLVPRRRSPVVRLPGGLSELPPVGLVRLTFDDDASLLRAVAHVGVAGLVVEVFGPGHASAMTIGPLRELAATMPVVFTSRTGAGEILRSTSTLPGSERELLEAGLLWGGCLNGLKARLLLRLLLGAGLDRPQLAGAFAASAD